MIFVLLNRFFHFGDYAAKEKSFTIVNDEKAQVGKKEEFSLVDIFGVFQRRKNHVNEAKARSAASAKISLIGKITRFFFLQTRDNK